MSTQQMLDEIQRHSDEARGRLLTNEERELARQHAEQRDFGSSIKPVKQNITKRHSNSQRKSPIIVPLIVIVTVIMLVIIIGAVWYFQSLELLRSTAERELKGYATDLNHELPTDNQLNIESISVTYSSGGQMIVSFSQGNARCTAPVNSPDNQHNFYWVAKIDAVPIDKIDTTEFKCVASVPLMGLGDITP